MRAYGLHIVDLTADNPSRIGRVAQLLVDGFAGTGSAGWRTIDEALATVNESSAPGRISRIAIDDDDRVLGWIAGSPEYDGHAWELHPLVVRRDTRRRGVGRALVADFEVQIRERGGRTIYLGADDEACRTSLGGVDLYPDVLGAANRITNRSDHPFEFYRKVGFVIVGVIPDANGLGKPDILMSKRVNR